MRYERTRAERRIDETAAELRRLRAEPGEPGPGRRRTITRLERRLEAAWRIVRQMREQRR